MATAPLDSLDAITDSHARTPPIEYHEDCSRVGHNVSNRIVPEISDLDIDVVARHLYNHESMAELQTPGLPSPVQSTFKPVDSNIGPEG